MAKYHKIKKCPEEKCQYWYWIMNISNPMNSEKMCTKIGECIRDYRHLKDEYKKNKNDRF